MGHAGGSQGVAVVTDLVGDVGRAHQMGAAGAACECEMLQRPTAVCWKFAGVRLRMGSVRWV